MVYNDRAIIPCFAYQVYFTHKKEKLCLQLLLAESFEKQQVINEIKHILGATFARSFSTLAKMFTDVEDSIYARQKVEVRINHEQDKFLDQVLLALEKIAAPDTDSK